MYSLQTIKAMNDRAEWAATLRKRVAEGKVVVAEYIGNNPAGPLHLFDSYDEAVEFAQTLREEDHPAQVVHVIRQESEVNQMLH